MLDMRTILLFTMIFNLIFGLGIRIAMNQRNHFKGVSQVGYGLMITSVGLMLMFLRDLIPVFMSVVVANSIIIYGVMITTRGLNEFYEKKLYPIGFDLGAIVAFVGLFMIYTYMSPNVNMRIVVICIYFSFYYALNLYSVLYKPVHKIAAGNWFIASIIIVAIVYYMFRIIFTLSESKIGSFMDAGFVHSFAIIIMAVWSAMVSFGIFIVVNGVTSIKLEKNAYYDSLTNLYNRHALVDLDFGLDTDEVNKPASYVICDIDNFKRINDTYGHINGDRILVEVANFMSTHVRQSDVVIRYGGDEFYVYLPNCKGIVAKGICDKIRQEISDKKFFFEEESVNISMSFGIYSTDDEGVNCPICIDKADKALYDAKENGRNQCVVINS